MGATVISAFSCVCVYVFSCRLYSEDTLYNHICHFNIQLRTFLESGDIIAGRHKGLFVKVEVRIGCRLWVPWPVCSLFSQINPWLSQHGPLCRLPRQHVLQQVLTVEVVGEVCWIFFYCFTVDPAKKKKKRQERFSCHFPKRTWFGFRVAICLQQSSSK